MSMTLTVPDEIASSVGDSAERLPISPELQAEFDFWDQVSDETMRCMDEQEDLGWHEPK